MDDCLFCKIADKSIPSQILLETEDIIAFLDIRPAHRGHAIIMPKTHVQIYQQLPDEVIAQLMSAVQTLSLHQLKNLSASGTLMLTMNGAAAGQRIPHLLVHLIPHDEPRFALPDNAPIDTSIADELKKRFAPLTEQRAHPPINEPETIRISRAQNEKARSAAKESLDEVTEELIK